MQKCIISVDVSIRCGFSRLWFGLGGKKRGKVRQWSVTPLHILLSLICPDHWNTLRSSDVSHPDIWSTTRFSAFYNAVVCLLHALNRLEIHSSRMLADRSSGLSSKFVMSTYSCTVDHWWSDHKVSQSQMNRYDGLVNMVDGLFKGWGCLTIRGE